MTTTTKSITLCARWTPPALADKDLTVVLSQEIKSESDTVLTASPATVHLVTRAPRLRLDGDQIAGCYPSPGSTTSGQQFLPHVALTRRTLPWERQVEPGWDGAPWMALLVLCEGDQEPRAGRSWQIAREDGDGSERLTISDALLRTVLPSKEDLPLLAFGCTLPAGDGLGNEDADGHIAVVLGCRLPDARLGVHTAALVSLEGRAALFDRTGSAAVEGLVVLHHWRFTPSDAADFELVAKAIRYLPNGGALAFGHVPGTSGGAHALFGDDGRTLELAGVAEGERWRYHGPLEAAPTARAAARFAIGAAPEEVEAAGADLSHAAAFELGRLLAWSEPGILEALVSLQHSQSTTPFELPPLADDRPVALQRRDWVVDEQVWAKRAQPWDEIQGQLQSAAALTSLRADPAGLPRIETELKGALQALRADAATQLNPAARVDKLQLAAKIDLTSATADMLTARVEELNMNKNPIGS